MRSSLIDQRKMKPESVMGNPIRRRLTLCQKLGKLQNFGNSQELNKPDITKSNSLVWTESKKTG